MSLEIFITLTIIIGVGLLVTLILYLAYHTDPKIKPTENLKLVKINVRKTKVFYYFVGIYSKSEYILKLKKNYLLKDFIPKEFLIEKSPKTFYYNYLKTSLQEEKTYSVTFGEFDFDGFKKDNFYILSTKELK